MATKDIDRGMKKIVAEMSRAAKIITAVGIFENAGENDGVHIAEYATYNEYGTKNIPSRPFMALSVDENKAAINADFAKQCAKLASGQATAHQALSVIGIKHADRIKNTITSKNIAPALADSTIRRKKQNSTKTLVDTGAMVNAVTYEVRIK